MGDKYDFERYVTTEGWRGWSIVKPGEKDGGVRWLRRGESCGRSRINRDGGLDFCNML